MSVISSGVQRCSLPPNPDLRYVSALSKDLLNGIAAGVLRLGIAQSGYVAYVEATISGSGFQYCVTLDGLRLIEGNAPDFVSAKQKAKAELRFLSSAPL